MLAFRPGIVNTCSEIILLPSSSSSIAKHLISHKHKTIGGSGGGKLDLRSDTLFIWWDSRRATMEWPTQVEAHRRFWHIWKKKKRREKSTSVLRLDRSSVATKVFCTQIGSMFGDFFDVFCTHRIGVGPLFEAISVRTRIGVPSR